MYGNGKILYLKEQMNSDIENLTYVFEKWLATSTQG